MNAIDRSIDTALRLIKKFGQKVYWVVEKKESDISEPWKQMEAVPVWENVFICFLPNTRQNRELFTYLRGTDVPSGSTLGLMGNVKFVPAIQDVIMRDDVQYVIKNINVLAPNGKPVLYTIEFE